MQQDKRVCETLTPTALQQLEDLHGTMPDHHNAGRRRDYVDLDTMIRDAITRQADNPMLLATHERLMIRDRRGRFLAIMNQERPSQAVSGHETLMRAVRNSDANLAASV